MKKRVQQETIEFLDKACKGLLSSATLIRSLVIKGNIPSAISEKAFSRASLLREIKRRLMHSV